MNTDLPPAEMARTPAPAKLGPKPCLAHQVLVRAQAGRDVVQQYVPLAKSLEWTLGQQSFKERGANAFTADNPVPFVINNSGELSRNAAEILFASLVGSAQAPAQEIYVLELGIGVGLFARYFLDRFRHLCLEHGRDFYDRLCYIAADRSPRMLLDLTRHGILRDHAGHYRTRVVDALKPDVGLPYDVAFAGRTDCLSVRAGEDGLTIRPTGNSALPRFHAVFLNYLLDCLPAAVLDVSGGKVKQLCVRTCLARGVNLADHTDLSLAALQERAKSDDPTAREELLSVYGLFGSEYAYVEMNQQEMEEMPQLDFAVEFGKEHGTRVLHNYGAIQCLDKLLDLLQPGGFILMNEYGMTKVWEQDDFEHQRFSQTTAVGVNFPLPEAYFAGSGRVRRQAAGNGDAAGFATHPTTATTLLAPDGDEKRGIHTRLLGRDVGEQTIVRFHERFKVSTFEWAEAPVNKARECVKTGRLELAASLYRQALDRQPDNWVLLSEIASFTTYSLRDPKAGADLAKLALRLNPACSSDPWCTLGDALFEWGRTAEARSAYLRALKINPNDVRARFNLAFVHTRDKKHEAALVRIGEALGLDKRGEYRERLLQKQAEVLQLAAVKNQQEYLRMVNLVSKSENLK